MSAEVRRAVLSSPSIDKSAPAWAEQQQDTPPLYALPQNATTTPSHMVVTISPLPPHQPVSESEWHNTLVELQNNLAALNQARCFNKFHKSDRRRFLKSLFNSKSFRKGAQEPKNKESDIERQARVQRIRVLEELVLSGMRKLARIHPEPEARMDWHTRAEEFATTIRKDDSTGSFEEFIANDKKKESILEGLAKGLVLLFMTPIALGGIVVFGTGAMIYGLGKVVVTIGHVMTFGKFH